MAKRFAFVAHDIKNVSSQLSLLLSNAETHLADPEFQKDMLATVRASVARIGGLIRRLEPGRAAAECPRRGRAEQGVRRCRRRRSGRIAGGGGAAGDRRLGTSGADAGAAGGHAAGGAGGGDSRICSTMPWPPPDPPGKCAWACRWQRGGPRGGAIIDIEDDGGGMTPEFIRDELFRPFATSKPDGSGIGAFQARELVRAAGGDISVISRTGSSAQSGTLMRLSLPLAAAPPVTATRPALAA